MHMSAEIRQQVAVTTSPPKLKKEKKMTGTSSSMSTPGNKPIVAETTSNVASKAGQWKGASRSSEPYLIAHVTLSGARTDVCCLGGRVSRG